MARLFDDASNQYLSVAQPVVAAVPLTMAAWIYKDDTADDACVMSIADVATATHFFQLEYWNDELVYAGTCGGGAVQEAMTSAAGGINTWVHACGVFPAINSRAVFLNGGSKGTNSGSATPAGLDNTSIGAKVASSIVNYASGRIAEAAIWDVALTDTEVALLSKGFSPLFIRPQNLVAYWPLIRDTDDDIVGGYSMTPYNTPTVAAHPRVLYPTAAIIGKSGVVLAVRIPRPPAAYNTLAIY